MGSQQPSVTDRNTSTPSDVKLVSPPRNLSGGFRDALLCDPCCWCGERGEATIEHIQPRSQRGSNKAKNLAGACKACNNGRGVNSLLHWMLQRIGETG